MIKDNTAEGQLGHKMALVKCKLMLDGMLSGVAVEPAAVVGRMTSIAGRTYSLVKSDLGLIIILLTYSFLGAVILHHAEYDEERKMLQKLDRHKRRCSRHTSPRRVRRGTQDAAEA